MLRPRRIVAPMLLMLLCCSGSLISPGCGTGNCTGDTPVPRINAISPTTLNMDALPVSITVFGSKFVRWSVVNLNGTPLNTTFVNDSRLTATVPAETLTWWNISSGSTVQITVTNAGSTVGAFAGEALGCSNGGTSTSLTLKFE
jgi:hypothetical protein